MIQLDRPDPEIDGWWADEAKTRWQGYQEGRLSLDIGRNDSNFKLETLSNDAFAADLEKDAE